MIYDLTLETTVESVLASKRVTHILEVTTKRSVEQSVKVYRLEE